MTATITHAAATHSHGLRPRGVATAAAVAGEDTGAAVCTLAELDEAAETAAAVGSAIAATLAAELFPESISRFRRFMSARISDATW
jgi:hypothetical protein